MKARKLIIPLLLLCVALFIMAGCTSKTKYDDKEVLKIATSWRYGLEPITYLRTFDFTECKVYDTLVVYGNISNILESTSGFTADDFNNPKQVATFTREQASALYEEIKTLGFLTWKEEYRTNEIIYDVGHESVSVYFADETMKSTYMYLKYPPKYEEIYKAFEEYLGVSFFQSGK